ncbi:pyrroline-5-carboxylate reductase dimerization-domain-containing protein [Hyaloraphidium curvatum]|nr:pyrroline-5-carboxylate reductase dimerization-domain-containing protein [Hyaloraphidium curvatum]
MAGRLVFIGGGNMGGAIIGGLLARKVYGADDIVVSEPHKPAADALKERYHVRIAKDNSDAVNGPDGVPADVVVLAVKPQVLRSVCEALAPAVQKHKPLVLSIAAGIRAVDIGRWLGDAGDGSSPVAVVRSMPNTPALLGQGAAGMFASPAVSEQQKTRAVTIMEAVSPQVHWVPQESLIDVVTALSGSGPAYFFLMVEALEDAAVKLGLSREVARALAAQTCVGAGLMVIDQNKEGVDPAELRRRVTSPQGTTEAGVKVLEGMGFRDIVAKCVDAANNRGIELGDVFGKDASMKM